MKRALCCLWILSLLLLSGCRPNVPGTDQGEPPQTTASTFDDHASRAASGDTSSTFEYYDHSSSVPTVSYSEVSMTAEEIASREEEFKELRQQEINALFSDSALVGSKDDITESYQEQELIDLLLIDQFMGLEDSPRWLYQVNNLFPIQYLKQINEQHIYIIYRTKENGLLYVYLEGCQGSWLMTHSAYVKKNLYKADFNKLQKGDSSDMVISIDPAASFYVNEIIHLAKRSQENGSKFNQFVSYHLLRDGAMVIHYEQQEDKSLLVSNITYAEDYQLDVSSLYQNSDRNQDFTILPEDFIGA